VLKNRFKGSATPGKRHKRTQNEAANSVSSHAGKVSRLRANYGLPEDERQLHLEISSPDSKFPEKGFAVTSSVYQIVAGEVTDNATFQALGSSACGPQGIYRGQIEL
jgi:hypothetical protein